MSIGGGVLIQGVHHSQ